MTSNLERWMPVIAVIFSIGLNGFLAWVAWSMRQLAKQEVAEARTGFSKLLAEAEGRLEKSDGELDDQVDGLESRMTRLEQKFDALPQRADFDRLLSALGKLTETVSAQGALLSAVKDSNLATQGGVDRLYRFMLESR